MFPLPGLVNIQKAIENGPVEIVDCPMKNGGFFHSYVNVYQRVYPSIDRNFFPAMFDDTKLGTSPSRGGFKPLRAVLAFRIW